MKIGIIGSRKYPNLDLVKEYIATLPKDTIIVTGGWPSLAGGYRVVEATAGVDRTAYIAAEAHGLVTVLVTGSKTKHKHMAGVQRNPFIVELSDSIVAFWDMKSRGSARTIAACWAAQKIALCIGPEGQQVAQPEAFVHAALR